MSIDFDPDSGNGIVGSPSDVLEVCTFYYYYKYTLESLKNYILLFKAYVYYLKI